MNPTVISSKKWQKDFSFNTRAMSAINLILVLPQFFSIKVQKFSWREHLNSSATEQSQQLI